jgi:hypothetical protein
MNILSFFKIEQLVYIIALGALGGLVFKFHYQPMKNLKEKQAVCLKLNTAKQDLIDKLEIHNHNLEVLLMDAKANLKSEKANTELCELKQEALQDVNATIKDTEDEGYLIF